MDDSDSSGLSSAPASDDERLKLAPIFLKAKSKSTKKRTPKPAAPEVPLSPPRPPRSPSPARQTSLADNPDIAFLVMFRSRFSAAFPPKLPHLGPQDIERGVESPFASPAVEDLLCALLGIALNRKKPVERGHHTRALEDALTSQRSQWPRAWNGQNPTSGGRTFNSMNATERLDLLRTLVIWSLTSSEVISQTIKDSYKQSRHDDDRNQPLSVQPWGVDGDKRRYWLVEGQDDTNFRLYRENAKSQSEPQWYSMAGSIDEIKVIAERLTTKDTTQAARRLASSMIAAIPRFEATEEKRKRREYRQMRRAQFARPEPGFSLYEGRTRGKRMRYTFDDEFDDSDDQSVRRSGRHSDRSTPAENAGPVVTASGRQVRARGGGLYGESLLSGQGQYTDASVSHDYDSELSELPDRRSSRNAINGMTRKRKHIETYNAVDQMSDEDDAISSAGWNSADNEDEANGKEDDDADDLSDDDEDAEEGDGTPASLVVKLRVSTLDNKSRPEKSEAARESLNGSSTDEKTSSHRLNGNGTSTPQPEDKMDWSSAVLQSKVDNPSHSHGHDASLDTSSSNPYRTPSSLASETKLEDTTAGMETMRHPMLHS